MIPQTRRLIQSGDVNSFTNTGLLAADTSLAATGWFATALNPAASVVAFVSAAARQTDQVKTASNTIITGRNNFGKLFIIPSLINQPEPPEQARITAALTTRDNLHDLQSIARVQPPP